MCAGYASEHTNYEIRDLILIKNLFRFQSILTRFSVKTFSMSHSL